MTGRAPTLAEADARFFQRFTHRYHRIRVAAQGEAVAARRQGFLTMDPPAGFRAFIGVRFEGSGRLHYAIGHLRDDADCDMGEEDATACFALLLRQDGTPHASAPIGRREVPRA